MKKLLLLLAIGAFLNQSLAAQEAENANRLIYVELGGPAVLWSVNAEFRLKPGERLGLGFRLGGGFLGGKNDEQTCLIIPLGVNYLFGKPNSAHTLQTGAGVTFTTTEKRSSYSDILEYEGNVMGFLTVMYRMMPVKSGLSFHIGFTPLIDNSGKFFPWGAIGVGYAF